MAIFQKALIPTLSFLFLPSCYILLIKTQLAPLTQIQSNNLLKTCEDGLLLSWLMDFVSFAWRKCQLT